MTSYTTIDYKKYIYALGTRDVRRITAKVLRAGLDSTTENEIVCLLERAQARLLLAAFFDGADDTYEDGSSLVGGHLGRYTDGRPVTSRIDWGDGYATIVHPPDPQERPSAEKELEQEAWPSSDPEPPCQEPEDDTDGEGDVE